MEATSSKLKLFISYNSSDEDVNAFVCQLKTKLESDGCDKAFIFQSAKDNRPGDNWPDNVAEEIKCCDAFIAIITQGYLNSDICFEEFHIAHVTLKKRIIPIIFHDRKPDYNTGKHGGAIQMEASPIIRVSFQKPEMEEIPYNKVLIGLGLKEALPGTEETDIGSTPGNDATSMTQQSSVTCDSLEIFQCYSARLCNAFEADHSRVANELHSASLIGANIKRNVSSMTGTAHDKANQLVINLQINLENDDNRDNYLRKICDCLQNKIKDKLINKIGADMEKALGES